MDLRGKELTGDGGGGPSHILAFFNNGQSEQTIRRQDWENWQS